MRRVVLTGMGIVSSIGNNSQEVLASLREAKSGITYQAEYAELGMRCAVAGAPTLNAEDYIDRRAMRFHGGGTAWNHVAMDQAIRDSGLEPNEVSNERTGIVMGSGGPSTRAMIGAIDKFRETHSTKRVGPFAVPKTMSSTASATLATWFKIKGLNYSISSACATSVHCVGNAYENIQFGKQDIVFAGGAGVLVLEELEHAKARGARIYGEIVGYGATSDGYDMVQPSGEGAVRCMKQAMATVHNTIDYINPHGTSTPVGDSKEMQAVREVFGNNIPSISSTKSLTGHSLGATGVQEAIYCLLMMKNGFLAESANIEELDPEFADIPILRKRVDNAKIDTVMSNSFGFGGTNATLIMQRYNG